MFRSVVTIAFSLALLSGAPAQAQSEPAQTSAAAEAAAPVAKEKKICKQSQKSGTRLGKQRTCKTAAEWARYENQNRDDASRMTEMKGDTDMGGQ